MAQRRWKPRTVSSCMPPHQLCTSAFTLRAHVESYQPWRARAGTAALGRAREAACGRRERVRARGAGARRGRKQAWRSSASVQTWHCGLITTRSAPRASIAGSGCTAQQGGGGAGARYTPHRISPQTSMRLQRASGTGLRQRARKKIQRI